MTVGLEFGVLGLNTGGVIGLEELAQNVLLFVPGAHVGGTVEVLECSGLIACGAAELFSVEFHW